MRPTADEIAVDNVVRRMGYCSYLLELVREQLHRAPAAHRAQFADVLNRAQRALEEATAADKARATGVDEQASGPEKGGP